MRRMKRKLALTATLGAVALAATAILFTAVAPAGYGPKIKPRMKSHRVISSKTFSITGVDHPQRYQVYCPRGKRPLGGGAFTSPAPDAAGGGAYPVSYERLGQQ